MFKAFVCSAVVTAMLIPVPQHSQTPGATADDLLTADRAFSTAAKDKSVTDALVAMFREDVIMTSPKGFMNGRDEAKAMLQSNPANAESRTEWTPVRAGVSADGLHGFTFGRMTMRLADGTVRPAKYMAYWIKGAEGWRVAGYKRAGAGAADSRATMMEPSLPSGLVPPSTEASVIDAHRESLRAAEQAFSDEAQTMGIGPAFMKWGRADAVNMGRPDSADFTVSAAAIGGGMGPDTTKPGIHWNADHGAIVASSGDLGVTFGHIRADDGSRPPQAFFTIWRRDSPASPWRYIAE
ncbi:MAG: nuclear transport factor 2 family protein [Acidobacteriota bacterium]|nr:nuclear transport factor 2 family protein [Acidobacteriota bacterium]